MTREQIIALAMKASNSVGSDATPDLFGEGQIVAFFHAAIESYKEELLKEAGEPVAVTNHAQLGYVTDGMHPDIPLAMWAKETSYSGASIALYTSDQVAAAILKATKALEEEIKTVTEQKNRMWFEMQSAQNQLVTAEQRVAESCAKWIDGYAGIHQKEMLSDTAKSFADALRRGEWRKFLKEGE